MVDATAAPAARADRGAGEIDAELRALATPQRAESERRYLKSDRLHYGTSVPDVRATVKRFLRAEPALDHDDLLAVCQALWDHRAIDDAGTQRPVHDRRMAALELLQLRTKLLSAADLRVLEQMLRESGTWALVDGLAGNVVADIVAAEPDALEVLDRWVADADFWVRRSAVLGLRTLLRNGTELERFFRYADQLLPEPEFFIRKVLGWVARETGRRYPEPVAAWLRRNLAGMNGVTIREAVKSLPDGGAILAEWKAAATAQPTRRNSVG